MKKKALFFAMALLAGSLTFPANARKIDPEIKAVPHPSALQLKETDGHVDVVFKLEIPKKFVRNRERFVFTPVMTNFDRTQAMPSIVIEGKKFHKVQRRLEKKGLWNDKTNYTDAIVLPNTQEARILTYNNRMRYQPWMKEANLVTVQKFFDPREMTVIAEDVYARGVQVQQPVVKKPVKTVVDQKSGRITMNFPINSDQLDMSLGNNDQEAAMLRRLVRDLNKPNVTIESIRIVGSSSPDGDMAKNAVLAQQRADALKNYLVGELNVPASKITTSTIAENWNGLEKLVGKSTLADKDRVLKTIRQKNDASMRSLPQYRFIKNELLPQLRYATYEVNYSVKSEVTVK